MNSLVWVIQVVFKLIKSWYHILFYEFPKLLLLEELYKSYANYPEIDRE